MLRSKGPGGPCVPVCLVCLACACVRALVRQRGQGRAARSGAALFQSHLQDGFGGRGGKGGKGTRGGRGLRHHHRQTGRQASDRSATLTLTQTSRPAVACSSRHCRRCIRMLVGEATWKSTIWGPDCNMLSIAGAFGCANRNIEGQRWCWCGDAQRPAAGAVHQRVPL